MGIVDLLLISIGSASCLFVLLMDDMHSQLHDPHGILASRRKLERLVTRRMHGFV